MGNQAGSLKKHIETAEKTGEPFVTLVEITNIETTEKTGGCDGKKNQDHIFMVWTKNLLFCSMSRSLTFLSEF